MLSSKKAFTLVELIVVVTILAILGTIWFTSFLWYQVSARDSIRISDISLIERQLSYSYVLSNMYPLPDEKIIISASWTVIWYQWKIGNQVLSTLKQAGEILDPLDGEEYTFFVNDNTTHYQIFALMEKSQSTLATDISFSTWYAEFKNSENRFPKLFWKALWILTDENNIPINSFSWASDIDVLNYAWSPYTAHFTSKKSIAGTGKVLRNIIPNANCTRIKQMWSTMNWVYTLNPNMFWEFEWYCDMSIDDDGWLLVARTHQSSEWNTDFGWLSSTWALENDNTAYSLWESVKNMYFTKILFWTYELGKNITAAMSWNVNSDFFSQEILNPEINLNAQNSKTSNCTMLFDTIWYSENCIRDGRLDRPTLEYWGGFWNSTRYIFNRQSSTNEGFVYPHWFYTNNNSLDPQWGWIDNFRNEQGMLFIK